MKPKTRILMVMCLLAVAGVWVYWSHERRQVAASHNQTSAAKSSGVSGAGGSMASTMSTSSTASTKIPTLNTNKLAYRLANTTNSLRQLQTMPHAILLANAFIDTDKPLDLNIPPHLRSPGDPGAYIVQARGPTGPAFRAALLAAGAQIVSYIPNNAYLVNISANGAGMLADNSLVQAVLPYEPYYKLQSSLLGLAVNQQALPPGTALTLGLFPDATAESQIEKLGARIIGHDQSPFGAVVRVLAPTDWTALVQSPVVQFAEPARTRMPANDLSRVTVGISPDTTSGITNSYAVNGNVLEGKNVLVAVNDSGVDYNHPAFSLTGTAGAPGTAPPSRVTGLTPLDLVDTNGHGTHVAGIIAGNGSASYGGNYKNVGMFAEGSVPFADYRGKAPLANLFSLNLSGYSDYQLQTNAAMKGALISNNSWDYGNGDAQYDLAAASYDFATRDAMPGATGSQPVLFVFAAGNDGGGTDDGSGGSGDTILSPGTAKNVITVGALEQLRHITNIVTTITPGTGTNGPTTNQVEYWYPKTDSGTQVAFYSSRGNVGIGTEGNNGRFKPDVVSPGTFVVSTSSQFNDEWGTNAYYNPTNILVTPYTFQVAGATNSNLVYYNVAVPPNAVAIYINISSNNFSPIPFPQNLPIYCQQSGIPDPVNNPGAIDLTTWNDSVSIPPGGGNCTLPNLDGNGFNFAVGNTNNFPVNYNLTVAILVTNYVGNLYSVLEGMNDSLGGYYRYESGTSLAAADVSGVLALVQDYFTNQFQPALIPSPALMKAVLINGCRSVGNYGLAFTNGLNFQGWGLDNIQNCVPVEGLFDTPDGSTMGSSFFVEQNPITALATGDRHTYIVTLNTNADSFAQFFQLQATLVWTDPPGDPAAAIKLVNNLELVITNLDTGDVYFGNDISPDIGFNLPWDTNGPPNIDTINNVENVLLPPQLAGHYSVTVMGRSVNVNAVTAQTNNVLGQYAPNIVQDYALVVSIGEGEVTNAFSVTDSGIASNPTGDQDFTAVMTTNAPLVNQIVGASSPLLGTNTLPLGNNTIWGPNGVLTIGQTNQWHFYVVTNNGTTADVTNAAFITFAVNTLSIPRMGVYEDTVGNATTPAANLDMFVSQDPRLTNLNPVVIANCLAGAGNNRASLYNNAGGDGSQFVFYTNSAPGQVYYIGVQSEDQMASLYDFLPVFTDIPFNSTDQNGNEIVNGLLLPMTIMPGNNAHPGVTNVFALATSPINVERVTVTNLDEHQNFGDLFGVLSFGGEKVVLNNHDGFGNTIGTRPIVYDDTRDRPLGTTNSDGPGSLLNFRGKSALGPWILSVLDNSAGGFTGQVSRLTLLIQPHRDLSFPGVIVSVPPGGWFIDWVDVPPGYTNLTFFGTNVTPAAALSPPNQEIQMYEKYGNEPTLVDWDQEATLTNGTPPGNLISVGPPLAQGQYFIGLFNPNTVNAQTVLLSARLGVNKSVSDIFNYASGTGQSLSDDAVTPAPGPIPSVPSVNPNTPGSYITVPNTVTQLVASVNVGIVVQSPRISDYAFTLVSPTGQRVLLMENRGAGDTNGAGLAFVYTNVLNSTATGGGAANTNYFFVGPNPTGISVPITWNFFTVPDQMTVYDSTNPANFVDVNGTGPYLLYDSGMTNNPPAGPGGGAQNTIPTTVNVPVPPGVTNITIIMNQFGNTNAVNGDAWTYTAGAPVTNYEYLMFTDNTNLASVPIKFAAPPFNFAEESSNFVLSDFDLSTNGDYFGPTNIADGFGTGWFVPTNTTVISTIVTNGQFALVTNVVLLTNNLVSVVTDPSTALTGDAGGSNYLALGRGTITRTIPTVPGREYSVTFWYRGPGIAGWWRGEGNGNDSSFPENNDNNGKLIGRFNFPAGEVSQALGFEDNGNTYQFAGTNTYVQVPASSSLNVGAGGGFTVEGWINPTNLSRPQPLVEWLAHVPAVTNADTNLTIIQGPVLYPAEGHYFYLLAHTNWFQSEIWARQLGGDLATLETANEDEWVYDTFTAYGTLNRDLWIGFNDFPIAGTFHWISGSTNQSYTNWVPSQPYSACPSDRFTAIMGPTNAYPGLWQLTDSQGLSCGVTNPVYAVAEVPQIPTNGVQFWICGTNWTGPTNVLQGCLAANIVDTNYVSHWIYSAPGLLTSNVYQHVALAFDTNSGLARLFLNGTNVATSNLFAGGVSFVPKTDGDLLLGWDMSLYTNNFYGGAMDEMSIYGRALSDAEIFSIYHVSADTTNRLIGKFDPQITPSVGLAEASVTFGDTSNVIFGVNNQWQVNSYTFTATTNSMPLTISGIEPGILLDAFAVNEAPLTNLYYFPDQPLSSLIGDEAAGNWTLQVWDSRAGAFVTNMPQLLSWELSFVLASNALIAASLSPETPLASTVPSGQIVYYAVPVPAWAHDATNILVTSSQPVDLLYYQPANPPGVALAPDATLLAGATGPDSIGNPILTTASAPPFQLQPGSTYYLGVRNNTAHAAQVTLEVDFDVLKLTNGVPFTDILTNEYGPVRYFAFDVSSNAYEATFQLLQLSGNADLVVRKGPPLPALNSDDYGSFNNGTVDENIYVLTNSAPVPLSPGTWYLGVLNRDGTPIQYSVLARELEVTNLNLPTSVWPVIINLTNNVPFTWVAGPGADLTNFFRYHATNAVVNGTNVPLIGLRFELFNLNGDADLTLQSNALPLAPPFFQSSQNGAFRPELIYVFTNNVLTNLAADWYLGVPSHEITNVTYTIIAEPVTNLYFPAFPGAQGVGGGALGGRFGDVYHVISMADAGPSTLRDAVTPAITNRTVVFDVSGTINLASPLVITNSYLTIAGETAPGGGITVAGQMTTVQSAHDVVIRDVRFRSSAAAGFTNSFEKVAAGDYSQGQTVAGWTVATNQTSVVADRVNAYPGHTNFLALANGMISNTMSTVPGKSYSLLLSYRGPGIAGWWRAENNANSSVYGIVPSNVQNVSYVPGEVGNAFSFNSGLITMPPSTTLGLTNMTVEGWINPSTTAYEPLVEWGGAGQYSAAQLWVNGWGLSPNPGMLYVDLRPSNPATYSAPGIVPQNSWTHVAFTLDVNRGALIIYCNGAAVASTNLSPLPYTITPTASQPLNLGYRNINSLDTYQGYTFTGGMDEMSVYSRALSPSEIKAIFSNGSAGKFDPAVFSTAPDLSLAEAAFSISGITTNVFLGNNTNWQTQAITFTATGTTTPLVIKGVEPGMLLDSVTVTGGNLSGTLTFNSVSNVIADHVSTSWSTNADLSVLASTNVTVQWSIMADSLYYSTNYLGIGSLLRVGGGGLSFHHNLYADNFTGSPQLGDNLSLDFVNNVIYNWGLFSGLSDGTSDLLDFSPNGATNILNYVCNYLIAGPDTSLFATNSAITNIAFFGGVTNASVATWIFQTNNFIDSDTNVDLNGANTGWGMFTNDYTRFARGFPLPPVSVDEAYQAYEKVLDFAGVNMALRDPADTNIVTSVRYQTGRLIGAVPILPGLNNQLPYLDTDQDGIPDFWEYTFTPKLVFVPSNNNDRDGDGYTDLEEYNNWLAAPHALTTVTNPVGVDLYQLCGKSGHLAFFVTNGIHGLVYLTNVLGTVINTSTVWSNTIAVFTPTNTPGSGTNYYGYGSFDFFVTNLDTAAWVGPVTVSVIVSAVPITLNSNMPPVITPLISGIASDPTNYGGSDYYYIDVSTNDYGVLFEIDNPTGPMAMVVGTNYLPSLSSYAYYTNQPPPPANLEIAVLTNSLPVPLSPGRWYLGAVNESGSNVVYTAKATLLHSLAPPVFLYPTNTTVTNILEIVPWSVACVATDPNSPPLPLSFALVSGPSNLTVSSVGVINWTPAESTGPSTNSVAVSVSNGAFAVTNTFTIIVEETNLPPTLPNIPNQVLVFPNTLVVTNTGTDTDSDPLTYTFLAAPAGAAIDTNGIITWTPTLAQAQADSNYLFTTVVTDFSPYAVNPTQLSATNNFYVTVIPPLPPNPPPTNIIDPNTIQWFAVSVPTNAIYATNILVFATGPLDLWFSTNRLPSTNNAGDAELLTNSLGGSSVIGTNTVPLLVPGSEYFLGVQNTNNFAITNQVAVNFDLVFPPITNGFTLSIVHTNIGGTNGFLISWVALTNYQFHLQWTPALAPRNWVNFNGVISDASVFPPNGLFQYFDNGSQTGGFGFSRFYRVLLLNSPTNTPPFFLYAPAILYAPPSVPFVFTNAAGDWDVPAQTLTYSVTNTLDGANVTINSNTAVITWTPGSALLGQTNLITTIVTDNGVPPKSATNVLAVLVTTNVPSVTVPIFTSITIGTNGVKFQWTASTNQQFQIRWTASLAPAFWHLFPNTNTSTTGTFIFVDTNLPLQLMRFYQLILLP